MIMPYRSDRCYAIRTKSLSPSITMILARLKSKMLYTTQRET